MFKQAVLSILLISCLISPAFAENYNPGLIKPDSFLWNLDLQIERFHEQIQFNQNSLIELQLRHADERIGELQQNTNIDAVANEYNAVLERIRTNERVNYQSTTQIQERMTAHNIVLEIMERDGSEQLRTTLKTASETNTALQQHTQQRKEQISSSDMVWWQDFISNYPIVDMPTSALTMLNTDMATVHNYVPAGITQITITQENGNAAQEYIIKHTDTDIFISHGSTTNPSQSYTFTIQEAQRYINQYGSMVGL